MPTLAKPGRNTDGLCECNNVESDVLMQQKEKGKAAVLKSFQTWASCSQVCFSTRSELSSCRKSSFEIFPIYCITCENINTRAGQWRAALRSLAYILSELEQKKKKKSGFNAFWDMQGHGGPTWCSL